MSLDGLTEAELKARFALVEQAEGGFAATTETGMLHLLGLDGVIHWSRVFEAEVWELVAGAPLIVSLSSDGRNVRAHRVTEQRPSGADRNGLQIPGGVWRAAESAGHWSLFHRTGQAHARIEIASPDWFPRP
jgi:predicted cupin superfamily sugar epimerase